MEAEKASVKNEILVAIIHRPTRKSQLRRRMTVKMGDEKGFSISETRSEIHSWFRIGQHAGDPSGRIYSVLDE